MTMGNRNVERMLWCQPPITDIPPQSRWVLLLMAKAAHDDSQLYYGGVAYLALGLGYTDGRNGRRAIMRHLALLQDTGYLFRTDKRSGRRVVYELRLPQLLQ